MAYEQNWTMPLQYDVDDVPVFFFNSQADLPGIHVKQSLIVE